MMIRTFRLILIAFICAVLLGFGRNALAAPRDADPVVLPGSLLDDFLGDPITDVVAFAYDGTWQPIPFQIDEKAIEPDDTEPDYVRFEDGLLDANDELVFMPGDAGSAEASWPDDAEARGHPRAAITIVDDLGQVSGVVYLFNSTTLERSSAEYVSLDFTTETVTALSYTLRFDSANMLGVSDLFLNGQPADVLDRQKVRVEARVFGQPFIQNENDLAAQFDPLTTIVTGPIRLIEGGDFGSAFYGSRFDVEVALDIDALNDQIPFGGTVQSVRLSLDQNNPAQTGVDSYFDSNDISATIDGVADPAVTTALRDWYQVSGGASGGFVQVIPTLSIDGGTFSTYYEDAVPGGSGDTGDGSQFADTGIEVDNPSGMFEASQVSYVLSPNTSAATGTIYQQQATTPLSATVVSESFVVTAVSLSSQTATPAIGTAFVAFALLLTVCGWQIYRRSDR